MLEALQAYETLKKSGLDLTILGFSNTKKITNQQTEGTTQYNRKEMVSHDKDKVETEAYDKNKVQTDVEDHNAQSDEHNLMVFNTITKKVVSDIPDGSLHNPIRVSNIPVPLKSFRDALIC